MTIICIRFGVLVYVVQGCQVGFFGYNCTQPCRYPSFGDKCQRQYNLECNDGYYGQDCISPCKYPSYGEKCLQICNCVPFKCNNIDGCENITELTEMPTTKSEEIFNFEWTFVNKHREAIIAGSSSLILIIAICLWLKRSRTINRGRIHIWSADSSSRHVVNVVVYHLFVNGMGFAVDLDIFLLFLWAGGHSALAGAATHFGAGFPLGTLVFI
uniref:EGF-like domain-containing protein n=1 Tax=Magallana gigas TaxID=29159 RepID=A0A8W8JTX8_MAGGI